MSTEKDKFWFELRFAAEKAAVEFKRFTELMAEGVKDEKRRLANARQEARERATEMEADYQAWCSRKLRQEEEEKGDPA